MNISLWGFVRFLIGVNLVVISVAYFATGWTIFESVPLNQAIVHGIAAVLGIRLALRAALQALRPQDATRSRREPEQDGSSEYGYNDQWERDNL